MYVLAVLYAVLAGLTAMVGSFADGGDIWSRLLLVLLHPLCAAGMLVLAFVRGLTPAKLLGIAALLAGTVGADLFTAAQIAGGSVKGDWWLMALFAVAPAIGVLYALGRALMHSVQGRA